MDSSKLLPPKTSGALCLFTVRKRCYHCATEWEAPAFKEYPPAMVLPSICQGCADAEDAKVRALTRKGEPLAPILELQFPTRPPDADE